VIASGSYLDNEFLEFTADTAFLAQHAADCDLFDVADIVELGTRDDLLRRGG
jgi:hypothetical protein